MIRVLVASPEPHIAARVRDACNELGVVADVVEGTTAEVWRRRSSTALVDVRMLAEVRRVAPHVRVLALGVTYGTREIATAVLGGARGYLPVGCRGSALLAAIRAVAADQLAIPPMLLLDVVDELVRQTLDGPPGRIALAWSG